MTKRAHILILVLLIGFTSCFKPEACYINSYHLRIGDKTTFKNCSRGDKNHEWTLKSNYQQDEVYTTENLQLTFDKADEYWLELKAWRNDPSTADYVNQKVEVTQPFVESVKIVSVSASVADRPVFLHVISNESETFYAAGNSSEEKFWPIYEYSSGCSHHTAGKAFTSLPLNFKFGIRTYTGDPVANETWLLADFEFTPKSNSWYSNIRFVDSTGAHEMTLDVQLEWKVRNGVFCDQ